MSTKWTERYNCLRFWIQVIGMAISTIAFILILFAFAIFLFGRA